MFLVIQACTGVVAESVVDSAPGGDSGDSSSEIVADTAQEADDARVRALSDLPQGDSPCQAPTLMRVGG